MLSAIADIGSSLGVYAGMGIGIAGVLVTVFIILYLRRYMARRKPATGAQEPAISNAGDLPNIINQVGALQEQQQVVTDEQPEENKLGGLIEKLAQITQSQSEGEGELTMDKQSEEKNILAQFKPEQEPEQEPESTEKQPDALALFTQTQAEDELESDEDQSAESDSEKETERQPKSGDSMLSLFETEIEDESGIAEFAQRLDDIDINSLIGEAQKIRDLLKGKA